MPSVVFVTEPFERVARSSAIARGYPKLPILVLPAELEDWPGDRVRSVIADRMGEVRDAWQRGAL